MQNSKGDSFPINPLIFSITVSALKIVLVVAAILFSLACTAQKRQSSWDLEPLQGNVKRIRYSVSTLVNKKDLGVKPLDTNSFLVQGSRPDPYKVIVYDNPAELSAKGLDTSWYKVDSFDKAGNIALIYDVTNGIRGVNFRFGYRFDAEGRMIEQHYTGKPAEIFRRTFTYDQSGKITEQTHYNHDGKFLRTIKYTYVLGLLAKEKDSTFPSSTTIYYTYDDSLKVIEETECCFGNGEMSKTKYAYDKKGTKISENLTSSNYTVVSNFDERGNIIGYNGLISILYTYDSYGNWTRRIHEYQKQNSPFDEPLKLYELTVREIEYY